MTKNDLYLDEEKKFKDFMQVLAQGMITPWKSSIPEYKRRWGYSEWLKIP